MPEFPTIAHVTLTVSDLAVSRGTSDCSMRRPSGTKTLAAELERDLREVTREIRPDWDLSSPGLRENSDTGDRSMHFRYKDADLGRKVKVG
jgi:hypothetical protein